MREYCIGAALLDRDDPTRVLGRSRVPLLRLGGTDPGGYVPNVVYSCGAMVHDWTLLMPCGVADSFTTFAHAPLDALLSTLA